MQGAEEHGLLSYQAWEDQLRVFAARFVANDGLSSERRRLADISSNELNNASVLRSVTLSAALPFSAGMLVNAGAGRRDAQVAAFLV
ncbi:hypothetical protein WI666_07225 [Vibrio cholerae]